MVYYSDARNEAIEKSRIYKTIETELDKNSRILNPNTRQCSGGGIWLSVVAEILKYEQICSKSNGESFDDYLREDEILDWFQTLMCSVKVLRQMKREWSRSKNKDMKYTSLQQELDVCKTQNLELKELLPAVLHRQFAFSQQHEAIQSDVIDWNTAFAEHAILSSN